MTKKKSRKKKERKEERKEREKEKEEKKERQRRYKAQFSSMIHEWGVRGAPPPDDTLQSLKVHSQEDGPNCPINSQMPILTLCKYLMARNVDKKKQAQQIQIQFSKTTIIKENIINYTRLDI